MLVRFYTLDHPGRTTVVWPVSVWPKLVFAASGTLAVRAEDRLSILPPTRALWVPPGARHEMSCRGAASIRTLYFHPKHAPTVPAGPLQVRPLLRELIVEACRVGPLLRGNPHHACLDGLLRSELADAQPSPFQLGLPNSDAARRAADLVLASPSKYPDAEAVAAAVACSRRTLERRFALETGLSLGRWLQHARLIYSTQLLDDRRSLLDVALAVGYATASAYAGAFRREFGVTPASTGRPR